MNRIFANYPRSRWPASLIARGHHCLLLAPIAAAKSAFGLDLSGRRKYIPVGCATTSCRGRPLKSRPKADVNKLGLHARASIKLINLAGRFESEILIRYEHREINAKSILGTMALGAGYGAEIELIVKGSDESIACEKISELINTDFGEN